VPLSSRNRRGALGQRLLYDPREFKGICVSGRAVADPEARAALWVEGWEMYYREGERRIRTTAVLRVDPVRARGWSDFAALMSSYKWLQANGMSSPGNSSPRRLPRRKGAPDRGSAFSPSCSGKREGPRSTGPGTILSRWWKDQGMSITQLSQGKRPSSLRRSLACSTD